MSMPFNEMLRGLKTGKKYRWEEWDEDEYIQLDDDFVIIKYGNDGDPAPWGMNQDYLFTEGWTRIMDISEKKKQEVVLPDTNFHTLGSD